MKGIELPINALIIIAVALLVLLGIAAMWMSGWGSGSKGMTIETAKEKYCSTLMRKYTGCASIEPYTIAITDFDANQDGTNNGRGNGGDWCWTDTSPAGCGTKSTCGGGANPGRDNLASLCACYYNTWNSADCRKLCGCGA